MLNKTIKILNILSYTLLVFCFLVFLLLRLNIIVEVKGISMNDTYSEGELLFTIKSNEFNYEDIVIIELDTKDYFIVKRIIAKENDVVAVQNNGQVLLNEEALDEPYAKLGNCKAFEMIEVPSNTYFCLGDNRAHSSDSRDYGVFATRDIKSKVLFNITHKLGINVDNYKFILFAPVLVIMLLQIILEGVQKHADYFTRQSNKDCK